MTPSKRSSRSYKISSDKLSIVVPLYNEEAGCKSFAQNLTDCFDQQGLNYELILVDNGSVDRTGQLINELSLTNPRITGVRVEVNQGFGWGIINGLQAASGDYVGFMGGDEQIRAEDVVAVYRKLLDEGLDFCKVKRITRHDGIWRGLISSIYNLLFPLLFAVKSTDINGTPKIFTVAALKKVFPTARDWFLDAEVMIKAARAGLRMGEIEIEFLPRQSGSSNVRLSTIVEFFKNMLYYRLRGFK